MGIVAILSLLVGILPAALGVLYAFRPSEAKLSLVRPVSLSAIFAGLAGLVVGLINMLRFAAVQGTPLNSTAALMGLAESLVPLGAAFASLTVAWLLVALGLRRQAT